MAECNKNKHRVGKRLLNFASKGTTTANVYGFIEDLLDNWLKNDHIIVDILYYLHSLLVSRCLFFTSYSLQTYCSTALILAGEKTL